MIPQFCYLIRAIPQESPFIDCLLGCLLQQIPVGSKRKKVCVTVAMRTAGFVCTHLQPMLCYTNTSGPVTLDVRGSVDQSVEVIL